MTSLLKHHKLPEIHLYFSKEGNQLLTLKFKRLPLVILTSFFTTFSYASQNHWLLSIATGSSTAGISTSSPEINYYGGSLLDSYPLNSKNDTAAVFDVLAGYEFPHSGFIPSIGLSLGVYATTHYDYNGKLRESAVGVPMSTLYEYHFRLQNTRLMAQLQLFWLFDHLAPFLDVGIGSAWNHATHYGEDPINNSGYVVLNPFRSQTSQNLAYQFGAGIHYQWHCSSEQSASYERISLGYRYVNVGDTSFGTRGMNYPYVLSLGNLYANEVYLAYTHLF